jgi:3-oxoacyl-[acyl-carrier protein] reductase
MRPVALITGSATGVGRACAVQLAGRGYDVVVNYSRSRSEAEETCELVRAAGTGPLLVACDVSDESAVRAMIEQTGQKFGRLDVLVNNAGQTWVIDFKNLDEVTDEKWDRIFAVNLKGPFYTARAAAPLLRASGRGAIVNVSSVAGLNGHGSSIPYCASKGALNTLTKSLARALAPDIRVNAVCPGPIDTRWMSGWIDGEGLKKLTASYPIPRASTPEDIAEAVLFLATSGAMVTGQCVVVDGGRTM